MYGSSWAPVAPMTFPEDEASPCASARRCEEDLMLQTRRRENARGFTLIELMIVMAIVGVLASIAIPILSRLQLRSRAAEGKVNLAAIRTVEEAYLAEFGRYVALASLGPAANSFSAAAESDIDADGTINYWGMERPNTLGVMTAPAANPGCPIGAVLDLAADPPVASVNLIGPCGLGFGLVVF